MKQKNENILAKYLAEMLSKEGLSQAQLAAKLKISKSTLHGYCNGTIPNGIVSLKKIADYFEITLDELIFGDKQVVRSDTSTKKETKYVLILKEFE